jgi:ribosomal protein L7/L12
MAKLGKIQFATLIAYISSFERLDEDQIEKIDDLISIDIHVPIPAVSCEAVDELLKQINNPDGFIPAIKAYRVLTGAGLKESKEAIERYRTIPKYNYDMDKAEATLRDILGAF